MPEGHVIHRLARDLDATFAGRPVAVSSPQGRFAAEADHLDARVLRRAEGWGKNLVLDFDAEGDHLVHVHLGLIGRLAMAPVAPPVGQVRLRLADATTAADLRGPQTCDLLDEAEWARRRQRIGPDPLRADADPEAAWARVRRSGRSVADLLMDQSVTAGVGNIFRAEVLFRARLDPSTPGRDLNHRTWSALWDDLVGLMGAAVEVGRIDTVAPAHTPEAMGRPPRVDRHGGEVYVYRREAAACHVCGSPVRRREVAGRHLYWCARCQRRHH